MPQYTGGVDTSEGIGIKPSNPMMSNIMDYGWIPPAAYGLYKLLKGSTPPDNNINIDQPIENQPSEIDSHKVRREKANADIAEAKLELIKKKLNPVQQTPTPEVTPEVPQQQNITLQDRLAMKPNVVQPTPEAVVPVVSPTASPEVKAIAPVMDAKTTALAEVATGKPVAPPNNFKDYIQKADQITPVVPPGSGLRRTADQAKVFKEEMPLNKGVNQIATEVGTYQPGFPTVPVEEHRNFLSQAINDVYGGKPPISQSGSVKQNKQLDNWIETKAKEFPNVYANYQQLKAMHGTQGGGVSLGMLGLLAGGTLAVTSMLNDYKKAQESGDYSQLARNAGGFAIGAVNPYAGMAYDVVNHPENYKKAMTLSNPLINLAKGIGDTASSYILDKIKGPKAGAGRGSQGISPP